MSIGIQRIFGTFLREMETSSVRPQRLNRAQQQAQTRERLLSAAERVFARHGYGGASVDLISAEAGYSKGAIYSNFHSKDAVFLALMRNYMTRSLADLEAIADLNPTHLASALSQWLVGMQTDNDCLMLTTELQLHARRNKAFAADFHALQEHQTRKMAEIMERIFKALTAPLPLDARDLAQSVIALAHGISLMNPQEKTGVAGPIIDKILQSLLHPGGGSPALKRLRR